MHTDLCKCNTLSSVYSTTYVAIAIDTASIDTVNVHGMRKSDSYCNHVTQAHTICTYSVAQHAKQLQLQLVHIHEKQEAIKTKYR